MICFSGWYVCNTVGKMIQSSSHTGLPTGFLVGATNFWPNPKSQTSPLLFVVQKLLSVLSCFLFSGSISGCCPYKNVDTVRRLQWIFCCGITYNPTTPLMKWHGGSRRPEDPQPSSPNQNKWSVTTLRIQYTMSW